MNAIIKNRKGAIGVIGPSNIYGTEQGYVLVEETLTLPEGRTIEEMIPVWLAAGKIKPTNRLF